MDEEFSTVVVIPGFFINQIIATKNPSLYIFRPLVVTAVAAILQDSFPVL